MCDDEVASPTFDAFLAEVLWVIESAGGVVVVVVAVLPSSGFKPGILSLSTSRTCSTLSWIESVCSSTYKQTLAFLVVMPNMRIMLLQMKAQRWVKAGEWGTLIA
jgi:hypothetical protein